MSPYGNDGEPWPGVIDEVPEVFKPFVEEPSFTDEDDVPVVTACLGREVTDDRWRHGVIDFPAGCPDPDGAAGLFELLVDRSPGAFQRFAEDYYEVPVDLEAVLDVYALRPLSQKLVSLLNSEVTLVGVLLQSLEEPGVLVKLLGDEDGFLGAVVDLDEQQRHRGLRGGQDDVGAGAADCGVLPGALHRERDLGGVGGEGADPARGRPRRPERLW